MSDVIQITSKQQFDEEIASGKVVVNFSGLAWCIPCQRFHTPWLRAADEVPEFKFLEVDVDTNEDIRVEYGVQSVPAVLVFEDGVETRRIKVPLPTIQFVKALRS